MCLRTGYSWEHFAANNSDKRWYYKFGHDTLVNLTALAEFLLLQEMRGDPMTQLLMAFNLHEYDGFLYPQGGGSWLFSNFAARRFGSNFSLWNGICDAMAGDDVALTPFFRDLNIDLTKHVSTRMIVRWPEHPQSAFDICPRNYYILPKHQALIPSPIHRAVGIHMHHIPMNLSWDLVRNTPADAGLWFQSPNNVRFCVFDHDNWKMFK
jgi:hypothetical protein